MSSEPTSPRSPVDPIVMRLRAHLRQMAPHQKERMTATLMKEAADELARVEERLRVLKTELLLVRTSQVNDRFDEGCQLRKFRELVDRWIPEESV